MYSFAFPDGLSSDVMKETPRIQWRDRSGFAPDSLLPLVATQGHLIYRNLVIKIDYSIKKGIMAAKYDIQSSLLPRIQNDCREKRQMGGSSRDDNEQRAFQNKTLQAEISAMLAAILCNSMLRRRRAFCKKGMAEASYKILPEVTLSYNTNDLHQKIAETVQVMIKENS
jgi:hypothetical protein